MSDSVEFIGATLLDRYEVMERLGGGGMADVYRAVDHRMDDDSVAIKVPKDELLVTPALKKKFEREIKQQIRLRHLPGVVYISDQGEHEGMPFFVMAYLPGGTLDERLKRGTQTPEQVLEWLLPVAEALDSVAKVDVIHRDVKPGNILFDADGRPVLSDFGIVKALSGTTAGMTATQMKMFTPGYAAPEQIVEGAGADTIDARADQYALACTVYAALAGRTPFKTANLKLVQPPPSVRDRVDSVPQGCADAIEKALSLDRDERYEDCASFAKAFGEGARRPAPPSSVGTSAGGRRRWPLLIAALAMLIGAGLHFGGVFDSATSEKPIGTVMEKPGPESPDPVSDTTAPVITLTNPKGPAVTVDGPDVVISGTVVDEHLASFLVDGVEQIEALMDGAFAVRRTLRDGETVVVRLEAVDAAGNRSEVVERTVTYAPASKPWEAPLAAALTALETGDIEEAEAQLTEARKQGVAAGDIPQALSGAIAKWKSPPAVEVTSPVDGSRVETMAVEVRGTVSTGRRTDVLFIDGERVREGAGPFTWKHTYENEGEVAIKLEVKDGDELRGELVVRVTLSKNDQTPTWAKVSDEQKDEAKRLGVPVAWENAIGMRFVLIPPGSFKMGAPVSEPGSQKDERPQHEVTITRAFYLQMAETTNAQYRTWNGAHDSGSDGRYSLNGDNQPAVRVSYQDIAGSADGSRESFYLRWLNEQAWTSGPEGVTYRLPTEAEWEYACRAGTTTKYFWGDRDEDAHRYANGLDPETKRWIESTKSQLVAGPVFPKEDGHVVTAPVGSFLPNPWGLYDMLGNASEWCADRYDPAYYAASPAGDPRGPAEGGRLVRGASYGDPPRYMSAAARLGFLGDAYADSEKGFRLVVSLPIRDTSSVPEWAKVSVEQQRVAAWLGVPVAWGNDLGMCFVLIPPGKFTMGSSDAERQKIMAEDAYVEAEWLTAEDPAHDVTITRAFYMQTTETTNAQYRAWRPDHDKNDSRSGADHPVARVSHEDIAGPQGDGEGDCYLAWLNSQNPWDRPRGATYRLPTEAEWEYACRAGTTTKCFWGASDEQAHLYANGLDAKTKEESPDTPGLAFPGDDGFRDTAPVGSHLPNGFGLHDMLGNLYEWCSDWFSETYYASSNLVDPGGPPTGTLRVMRGGSFGYGPWSVRAAVRGRYTPDTSSGGGGFRPVVSLPSNPGPPSDTARGVTWAMEMEADGPATVVVGRPFEVVFTVRNKLYPLSSVTLAARGTGLELVTDPSDAVTRFEEFKGRGTLKVSFVAKEEGTWRVNGSAREERGWAAAGVYMDVVAKKAEHLVTRGRPKTLQLQTYIEAPGAVKKGEMFAALLAVKNTGTLELRDVVYSVRGDAGLEGVGDAEHKRIIDRLAAGETRFLRVQMIAAKSGDGLLVASARESRGWAAAGAYLGVVVKDE